MKRHFVSAAFLLGLVAGAPAQARELIVQMKNQGASGVMVFEPSFVQANVGDTVRFVPTDPGHNAEAIAGIIPVGVATQPGALGKDYVITLSAPGLYGIKCKPHFSMGMVALIKAGKGAAPNAAAAKVATLPPLAAKRMAPMLAQATPGRSLK